MTDKKDKKTKKKGQDIPIENDDKPSKTEYAVAKYMKNKVPTKKTKFLNHQVSFFTANKAIDTLMDSPWATGSDCIFTDRASVVVYCDKLLKDKFFHRARKIAITDKDLNPKDLKKKKEKDKLKKKDKEKESKRKSETEKDEDESEEKKKKKKAKIKLDMHLEQVFVDGTDAYVWMYDPIPFWYYIAGALCLGAAVAICLFPLWPPSVRQGVYYLSIAAAGFLGVILGLAVIRFIIFIIIWVLSMGRHHFWILPNLTEDVGFFASFWPLYHYEYRGKDYKKSRKQRLKEMKEAEGESLRKSDVDEALESQSAAETDKPDTDAEKLEGQTGHSETESENSNSTSQASQTFELLSKEELAQED